MDEEILSRIEDVYPTMSSPHRRSKSHVIPEWIPAYAGMTQFNEQFCNCHLKQQFLNFLPLPQEQGAFRAILVFVLPS
ncbi:Uncharacterised protein [Legionella lansingensis]|uniref:Uncharacterized protein n=1 Tax=Legionella lansingensis TaxID=45067 RepID=A0A0W0VTR5_9GAMM|nr:hypothetical protein Llan_0719 [Legionella lansingensis]SNV52344.1 Uncharacterised protein [Legionella lansingensis]